jgi:mRNA-degrading endonuclease RelE of RelBE toxin-antitoxin system
MAPSKKTGSSRIKVHEMPESTIKGGTEVPMAFPHLYRIHAGDWRISYAVEHNRLAILVLEVLSPDESEREDTARQEMNKILKVRLLNSTNDAPDELAGTGLAGKKSRIKVLDVSPEDGIDPSGENIPPGKPRIRVLEMSDDNEDLNSPDEAAHPRPRVRILEISEPESDAESVAPDAEKKSRVRLLEISEEYISPDLDSGDETPKSRIKVVD